MPDYEEPTGDLVEPGQLPGNDPEAPPTPPPGAIDENERRTWEGRVQAEQRKFDEADRDLAPYGAKIDRATGKVVRIEGAQAQPPQQTDGELSDEEFYEIQSDSKKFSAFMRKERQRAQQEAKQEVYRELMPVMEANTESAIVVSVSDWNEIKEDVMSRAKPLGFNTLTDLKKQPAVFDLFVDAARGKRGTAKPATIPDTSRADLLGAASVDGNSASSEYSSSDYVMTPEDKRYAKEHGMTDAQYFEFISGSAKIKVGGKK